MWNLINLFPKGRAAPQRFFNVRTFAIVTPMSSIMIKNIGTLVTGKLEGPLRQADSIFIKDGLVQAIGNGLNQIADQTIDANGITAIPGLIDSHSHPSIGEYTPAQNSLGWITNYMHGGVTALISAGELHLPGLAAAARRADGAVGRHRYEEMLRQSAAVRS